MKLYQSEILKANEGQLLIDTKAYYSYYSDFTNLEKLVSKFANIDLSLQGKPLHEVEDILMDFDLYYGTAHVQGGHNFNYLTYNTTEDITNALAVIRSADFNII